MDLTLLRYFQAVAQAGSLTAAARKLGVSQPTLTVAMQKLEGHLDTTLLLRDRRGVTLTHTGRELLHHAEEIFVLVERAEHRVRGLETEDTGRFVIGCPDVLGAYFLPDFLGAYMRDFPRIELELWNAPSRPVLQAVVERKVHFGLVVNPLPHPDVVLVELFEDATDLCVLPDRAVSTLSDAIAELEASPFLFVEGLPQSRELLKRLAEEAVIPSRRVPCGNLELVKSLALSGVGVAMLPRRVARYHQEGRLTRLCPDLPYIPDTIHLVYRADLHRTRATMRLKDALADHGRALA